MKRKKGIEDWSSKKLITFAYLPLIVSLLVLFLLPFALNSTVLGYFVCTVWICTGLFMVIKAEDAGSAMWELNYRIFRITRKYLFHNNEFDIDEMWIKIEDSPIGYKFTVGIAFFVGLGLVAISVWAIFMLAQGKMF